MKRKKIIKAFAVMVLLAVCAVNVQAKKVSGSGNVIKETRSVEVFTRLSCHGIADVYLSQGLEEKLVVETDDNLQQYIICEFNDGKLTIKHPTGINFQNNPKIKIYITVKNLSRMEFYGVGDLECLSELNLDVLKISNNGVGNLKLSGTVKELNIQNNGVGNINAFDFVAKNVKLQNSGVGNVKINAVSELKINNSGIGNVEYKGGAQLVDIDSNGVGSIKKRQ